MNPTDTSELTGIDIALPLAGRFTGTVKDSASGLPISGICAYAIDTTANELRACSDPSTTNGVYTIAGLPPGTDRVAFEACGGGAYLLAYSTPVTVIGGGMLTVNGSLTKS